MPPWLVAGLPLEHRDALLEGLRTAESARLRYSVERLLRRHSVPHEPATDHDTGPSAAGPAVDEDDAVARQLFVDRVEGGDGLLPRWNREIADRDTNLSNPFRDVRRVRRQLALLGQIEDQRHAMRQHIPELRFRVLGAPRARMPAGEDFALLDPGRRAHGRECARPSAMTECEPL